MRRCKLVELAMAVLPFRAWQDVLIRRHFMKCPACRAKLADAEETRSLLISERDVGEIADFWPDVESAIKGKPRKAAGPGFGRWARFLRAAGAAAAAALLVWLFIGPGGRLVERNELEETDFRLHDIRIEDKPARAYVFQPQDSNIVIVWAEKAEEGG